jgi:phage gp36-like protein
MFLTITDYDALIKNIELSRIINFNHTYRTQCELTAQSMIESYLRDKYDVAVIFDQAGNARHPMIMRIMIDITLYELFSRITPDQIPDIRKERYEQDILWLEKIAKNLISVDLPLLPIPEGDPTSSNVMIISKPKQNFSF